jgi:para-nitrobenzyl esterase
MLGSGVAAYRPRRGRVVPTLVLAVIAALACSAPALAQTTVVTTQYGQLRGTVTAANSTFLGVPFATPPVGDLRWRPPRPPASWSGVRDAFQMGDRCAQRGNAVNPVESTSEDCLYLNVYAPASPAPNTPVMVWLHGGSFIAGTGNTYDGSDLAANQGVIVVTINYRVGPFGYLALPGLAAENPYRSVGNYGLLDQEAALRWVKSNIAAFGGNPDNVTVFGQSAGGVSVCDLLASPQASGLFAKAISESGPCSTSLAALARVDMQTRSTRFAARPQLGCTGTPAAVVTCMRSKSAEEVLSAVADREARASAPLALPNVDGHYLPVRPRQALATGKAANIPLLIGTTRNEASLFSWIDYDAIGRPLNADTYKDALVETASALTPVGPRLVASLFNLLYPLRNFPTAPGYDPDVVPAHRALSAVIGDAAFSCPAANTYREAALGGTRTYAFEFRDPSPPFRFGDLSAPLDSYHTSEIQYVFGREISTGIPFHGMSPEQIALSRQMQAYWANFARTGNPNGPGLPTWPAYNRTKQIMGIAPGTGGTSPISATQFGREHKCALWGPLDLILPPIQTVTDVLTAK